MPVDSETKDANRAACLKAHDEFMAADDREYRAEDKFLDEFGGPGWGRDPHVLPSDAGFSKEAIIALLRYWRASLERSSASDRADEMCKDIPKSERPPGPAPHFRMYRFF